MDIRYFKKYISIKTKKHWILIGKPLKTALSASERHCSFFSIWTE